MNAMPSIREDLKNFTAYSSARMEAVEGRVWLNANELPWGEHNRYPNQQSQELVMLMSDYYKVKQNQLLVTRGSDEGIDLLIRLFCQAYQDAIMITPPTFGMYAMYASLQGAKIIEAPLISEDFTLDCDLILERWQPSVKIVFLCSPNNPTGQSIDDQIIEMLCERLSGKAIVVVDEAYCEFSESLGGISLLDKCDNLVVLRTLSKGFGLAALRIGVILGNNVLINTLKKILAPYPLSALSVQSAIAAFQKTALARMLEYVLRICNEKARLSNALQDLNIVKRVWPSQANFLLVEFNMAVENDCLAQGIILRKMDQRTGIVNSMRISVGTTDENTALLNLLGGL